MDLVINESYFIIKPRINLVWKNKSSEAVKIEDMSGVYIKSLLKCFKGQSSNFNLDTAKKYYGVPGTVWLHCLQDELLYRKRLQVYRRVRL